MNIQSLDFIQSIEWKLCVVLVRLRNRREYKVVVLNGVASHVLNQHQSAKGIPFVANAFDGLREFAQSAVLKLKRECAGSLCDFIIRVDIMSREDGSFVVNEYESFEAIFYSNDFALESTTQEFIRRFWSSTVKRIVNDLIPILLQF